MQIIYLIYLAANHATIPTLSIILIVAVYGLQALVFVLRRKWDMIGWMIFYILAVPAFSFMLPLYSFWKMDDFSWGNTRVVVGEGNNKKVVMAEEEKFDESMIPLKKFSGMHSLYKMPELDTNSSLQNTRLRLGRLVLSLPLRRPATPSPRCLVPAPSPRIHTLVTTTATRTP